MLNTPVLFLMFNRPDTTALVFEKIKNIRPKYLYVAADGPRGEKAGEAALCNAAREIVLNGIDWECSVQTLFRDENVGCRKAVSDAIGWFFDHVEQGIILEDDCLPDSSFFYYCEELLEKYKLDESIISIGGTNMGYELPLTESYSFSRFMNMWGWATWRRSIKLVDYDMLRWKEMLFKNMFLHQRTKNQFPVDLNWIKYWRSYFDLTASGKINTWDYQWIFAQLCHRKLSIFPAKNLVKNIGFTEQATHTKYPDHPIAKFAAATLIFPLKHPQEINNDEYYEEEFLKKIWFGNKKESVLSIVKTRLLYIPLVYRVNQLLKKRKVL